VDANLIAFIATQWKIKTLKARRPAGSRRKDKY
jgi:hypothetical protein